MQTYVRVFNQKQRTTALDFMKIQFYHLLRDKIIPYKMNWSTCEISKYAKKRIPLNQDSLFLYRTFFT